MKMNKRNLDILRRNIEDRRGQSLILALVVLACLSFIGGIFIVMIGRNIGRSTQSEQTMNADYYAEAGVRYVNDQLTYSEDGADWRPAPSYPKVVKTISDDANATDSTTLQTDLNNLSTGDKPATNDPDYKWLINGFSRFNTGSGRFLLRVSYQPTPGDSMSKYIKIESIGRIGTVDPTDPTTLATRQPSQQFSSKVAYKAIGITDYARFVTNKDRRPDDNALGTPGYVTNYGTGSGTTAAMGAPIRVNGNLTWYGTNNIWLENTTNNQNRNDNVEVAGDIKYATLPYNSANNTYAVNGDGSLGQPYIDWISGAPCTYVNGNKSLDSYVQANPASGSGSPISCFISDPDDTSANQSLAATIGRYRDGNSSNDYYGHPRGITRLDPPLIDAIRATGVGYNRYRDLTRNSGTWQQDANKNWYNTGYYGYGSGLYINNPDDIQQESSTNSLRGNWTQPGTQYWNGPYYTPPGVSIVLSAVNVAPILKSDGTTYTGPEVVLTQDVNSSQQWYAYDSTGHLSPISDSRIVMPYPDNGVIYAEGNIRIKGTLPAGQHLTVVSGGTIYIEGSILKCPFDQNGNVLSGQNSTNAEPPASVNGVDRGSIALLATDYICVNTTQFFAPTRDSLMASTDGDYFDISPNKSFWMNWSFGVSPSTYSSSTANTPVNLLVRQGKDPASGTTLINMLMNYPPSSSSTNPLACFYNFGSGCTYQENYASPNWEYKKFQLSAGDSTLISDGTVSSSNSDNTICHLYTYPGVFNTIGFQLDQTTQTPQGLQDYYLSRAAVVPSDIRIEALLYAQNKSFFVIPGEWFNPDPSDVASNWSTTNPRSSNIDSEWPYYGEPLDVRIVIYGAVSENVAAPIGDSSAWMAKWGWIPPKHGSSSVTTVNYRNPLDPTDTAGQTNRSDGTQIQQQGLTFIYDSTLSCPLTDTSNPTARIRYDDYDRTLPLTPKLPVSSQLLYFGSPT